MYFFELQKGVFDVNIKIDKSQLFIDRLKSQINCLIFQIVVMALTDDFVMLSRICVGERYVLSGKV